MINNGEDIVIFIKSRRFSWLGHVKRMPKERMPLRILDGEIFVTTKREIKKEMDPKC